MTEPLLIPLEIKVTPHTDGAVSDVKVSSIWVKNLLAYQNEVPNSGVFKMIALLSKKLIDTWEGDVPTIQNEEAPLESTDNIKIPAKENKVTQKASFSKPETQEPPSRNVDSSQGF